MDGRSLVRLLRGRGAGWTRSRAILTEYQDFTQPRLGACAYAGIRLPDRIFVQYSSAKDSVTRGCTATSESEFYDLSSDPFELENLSGDHGSADEVSQLEARLAGLQDCAGIAGRDEQVAGRPYCE
jgi:hypothetical protein